MEATEDAKRRINVMFRPTEQGSEWIEELAHKHRVKRTDVVRESLHVASAHQSELEQRLKMLSGF